MFVMTCDAIWNRYSWLLCQSVISQNLGAKETPQGRILTPEKKIMHCELIINDGMVYIADQMDPNAKSSTSPTPVSGKVYMLLSACVRLLTTSLNIIFRCNAPCVLGRRWWCVEYVRQERCHRVDEAWRSILGWSLGSVDGPIWYSLGFQQASGDKERAQGRESRRESRDCQEAKGQASRKGIWMWYQEGPLL